MWSSSSSSSSSHTNYSPQKMIDQSKYQESIVKVKVIKQWLNNHILEGHNLAADSIVHNVVNSTYSSTVIYCTVLYNNVTEI